MNLPRTLKLVATTICLLIVNVAVSIGVVAFYAYLIDPGHPPEHYQAFAVTSSPYSSVIAGIPLMFGLCWWLSRRTWVESPERAAWIVWITYVVLDLGITFASVPPAMRIVVFTAISLATKLGAGLLGARYGSGSAKAT